jgi:selenide,water dikinase
VDHPRLLVGLERADDAGVYQLTDDLALIQTVDFFTPIVDEPLLFGQIAAANALSDVYAMGGRPFLALNVAAFPPDLPADITGQIILGGAEKAREAGVVLAGGHTIQDKEPKYGLIALGFVHPQRMITKGGLQIGDRLVISKPIGFGTITTALKLDQADPTDVSEAVGWMKRLNKIASELAVELGVRSGTDVTGFGLIGHAWEMATASRVGLRFHFEQIPFTRGAQRSAQEWIFPGGSADNRLYFGEHVEFKPDIDEPSQMLMFDAQTSGGLLLAVPQPKLDELYERAAQTGQMFWEIGEVISGEKIFVD